MNIEGIGLLAIALGIGGLLAGPNFAVYTFVLSTLLAAAAAVTLPSLGAANIQPAHLLLGFLVIVLFFRREFLSRALAGLVFPKPGFWLLIAVAYGVASAFLLPRLFAGLTYVYAIARTHLGPGIILVPLVPVSGNITQSIYLVGDLLCFLAFCSYASSGDKISTIARAGLLCAALNLTFAAVDMATYAANMGYVLDVIRNAKYSMLNEATVSGVKRIVGSFTEASGYAYMTLGLFAFTLRLWLGGYCRPWAGLLCWLSLITLLLSTSTTAYAGLFVFVIITYSVNFWRALMGPVPTPVMSFVGIGPLLVACAALGVVLHGPTWTIVQQILDTTVFNKVGTASGIERGRWNEQAMVNFLDTFGFGAGLGSTRASNFVLAVLSNIGIFGALAYGAFLLRVLRKASQGGGEPFGDAVQDAARSACLAFFIAALVSGGMVDLGLSFFMFAGVACAARVPERARGGAAIPGSVPVLTEHLRKGSRRYAAAASGRKNFGLSWNIS